VDVFVGPGVGENNLARVGAQIGEGVEDVSWGGVNEAWSEVKRDGLREMLDGNRRREAFSTIDSPVADCNHNLGNSTEDDAAHQFTKLPRG
jgi:hypothetical protein